LNSTVATFLTALVENVRASENLETGRQTRAEMKVTETDANTETGGASGDNGFWTALGKKIVHSLVGDSTGTTTTGREESALPRDFKEAKSFAQANPEVVRRAAEQGDVGAQMHLGLMYHEGRGVPQDDAESTK
jgi:hypothetical protein